MENKDKNQMNIIDSFFLKISEICKDVDQRVNDFKKIK